MYEMYPDTWTDDRPNRQPATASEQPRRRARKEHSVLPAVIAQVQASKTEPS